MNMDFSALYGQYDFSSMEEKFESLFPTWDISFKELILEVMKGNGAEVITGQVKEIFYLLTSELDAVRFVCVTLLLIGIISTVFMNFSGIFPNQQIGDLGFKFTYLITIIFLIKVNAEVFTVAKTGLDSCISFLQVFLPCYFIVVGTAGGSATAFGFYQVFLIGVYMVEQVLVTLILPMISCYMLLCIMNGILEEERLSMFIRIVKNGVRTFLKILLTLAAGSGLFQSAITPVIDTVKMNAVKKTVEIIPGIGELADGSVQVMLGMSVLLKNALGIGFVVLLLFICAIPILKVFLFMIVIKGTAALMGLSADRRITGCTNAFGDGIMLLLQTMITAVMFFLILVLIVTFTANRGFM
ncbi:MAG: stage III sporulation protein AE [Lachnospiraceae bacterium]|nr:stage III sporulation protein AE [Lachnospiraceae bacterium]